MLGNGDDDGLDGGDGGGQNKAVIITVGHNDGADEAGGGAPGGLVGVLKFVVAVKVLNVKGLGKVGTEVVGSGGLKGFAVVH